MSLNLVYRHVVICPEVSNWLDCVAKLTHTARSISDAQFTPTELHSFSVSIFVAAIGKHLSAGGEHALRSNVQPRLCCVANDIYGQPL